MQASRFLRWIAALLALVCALGSCATKDEPEMGVILGGVAGGVLCKLPAEDNIQCAGLVLGAALGSGAMPEFPWPPPRASASVLLPRASLMETASQEVSLGAIGRKLSQALTEAGYAEQSVYRAPGGFALVARLERIKPDGAPEAERVRFNPPDMAQPFSLATYVQQLFFAPEGFYRQIVFVVNDQAFVASGRELTASQAQTLLADGANRLPPAFDKMAFSPAHEVTALIYEYRKGPADREVETLVPGRLSALQHLEGAGIDLKIR